MTLDADSIAKAASPLDHVISAVRRERQRQDDKWGDQRHLSQETWLAILVEEVGEAAKAILENGDNYHEELIQIAAVAIAAAEAYDQEEDRK